MSELKPVVVTTKHRGVFFGWADPATLGQPTLTLQRCRNCIRWAASIGGFLGLAKTGPDQNCRIGAEAPTVLLHDVTSVSDCTAEATDAWAKA